MNRASAKRAAAVLAAGMLLLLTACTGLPTSGPVQPGNEPGTGTDVRPYALVPDPPLQGASPQQIVDGFLRAGSGPVDEWATARLYLTPEFAPKWRPQAGVTIDRLGDRSAPTSAEPAAAEASTPTTVALSVRITPEAFVSGDGQYTPSDGNAVTLDFRLVQIDGQWRIDQAPEGVVLYQEDFRTVYQSANVMFFDPTWTYLVPDVRWFPRPLIATRVTQALIDGAPSEWLGGAVATAFPQNVSLVGNAVPVRGREAVVELGSAALGLEALTLDRMQTQLHRSLESVDVAAVQMTVGTTPLDAQELAVRSTRVDTRPLVELADGDFGFLGADSFEPVSALSEAVESAAAQSITVGSERRSAAVLTQSGAVVRANDDGTVDALDTTRAGLAPPSIDPSGAVWSARHDEPGSFLVFPSAGEAAALTAPWPSARRLAAFQVSRDGTRLAAAVSANGRTEVWVAGIARENGVPTSLSDAQVLATTSSTALDLAWLDDSQLGILLSSGETTTLLRQPIGGAGTTTVLPSSAVDIAGGNSIVRLRTTEGLLLVERGENWEEIARDVAVLAVQQGQPG